MRGCIERATPVERGGTDYNFVGINILGLGTLVDSLTAIEDVVFGDRTLTVHEMAAALDADWPDDTLRMRLLKRPGRYGSDSPRTNRLAHAISDRLARTVLAKQLVPGVQPYPGFFAFGADIHDVSLASPDGRRARDLITYGVGPATSVPTTPTTVLRSAAHVAHRLCGCGNPLALTLNTMDLRGEGGALRVRELVTAYFDLGGFHVHFNLAEADVLRQAQADPASHADLTVRVSGFSAQFVAMDPQWQDALIERAEHGL
jgi:formate C-acetyltransferase